VGYGLSVTPQNRRKDEVSAGHASRSSDLLHVEASRTTVFQSGIKTSGGTARMMHVTSSRRLCQDQVENKQVDTTDCVGPYYS
jgi:hypothetical protein